jgi:hypothetical protein
MTRRLFLLGAALLASLAVATPSQAGTMYVSDTSFSLVGATVTEAKITFNNVTAFDAGTLSVTASSGPAFMYSVTGDVVTITYSPGAAASGIHITFSDDTDSPLSVLGGGATLKFTSTTGTPGNGSMVSNPTLSIVGVPEPSSIALLGIGISGFIAFRRRFSKKLPAA